jgi:hypothetical protein
MKKLVKIMLSYFISILPIKRVKIFLYNILFGYEIDYSCKIGYFNIIVCNRFYLSKNASLGNNNIIVGGGGFLCTMIA